MGDLAGKQEENRYDPDDAEERRSGTAADSGAFGGTGSHTLPPVDP